MTNEQVEFEYLLERAPQIRDMLSDYGHRVYFSTDGILGQTWEARKKAYVYNATLGEAQERGRPIFSKSLQSLFSDFEPEQLYSYAHPAGLLELRSFWLEKMFVQNPSLRGENLSLPIVTCGLTHALSLVAELFVNPDDPIVIHDKHWENYEHIFNAHYNGKIITYPTFSGDSFNISGFRDALTNLPDQKALIVLNFPNNPTGYSLTREEAENIAQILLEEASRGLKLTILVDDAYYGFWYDEKVMHESLAGVLCNVHPNILVVRVDGVTKEFFAGGFRVGFLTFMGQEMNILRMLEQKAIGAIRAYLSSTSRPAQEMILYGLKDHTFQSEIRAGVEVIEYRGRYLMQRFLNTNWSNKMWSPYPFRSGYFLCLHMQDAHAVRSVLLEEYGIGVIALNKTDLRISFPCLEIEQLDNLLNMLDDVVQKVQKSVKI